MSATIREVARKCNVSLGTVSNVLNKRPSVTPAVRARVEAVISELGYTPNHRRHAASGSRPTICFLLANRHLVNPFHSRVLDGVSRRCEQQDSLLMVAKMEYGPDLATAQLPLPAPLRSSGMVDCVVLAGVHYPNLTEELLRLKVPYVLLANNYVTSGEREQVDQVGFDELAASRNATEYLIDLGHRDIWFIGDVSFPWFNRRYEGYLAAMRRAGLTPRGQTAGISDDHFVNGFRCTASILSAKQPMTAIFTVSDEVAYGCWQCLERTSIRVPEDVSLLGFDDLRGSYNGVGLSTVRVEAEAIGSHLAQMALEKARMFPMRPVREVVVPTKLIKRGTCQPRHSAE